MLKRVFYQIIVHSKYGLKGEETTFDFKYVPEYSTITEMGECEEEKQDYSAVEQRNLKTFVIATGLFAGLLGASLFVTGKVVAGVVRAVF
jgi:hypothetical protein